MRRAGMESKLAIVGIAALASAPAFAQSSVTLYGIIDNGFAYASNQSALGSNAGGHSVVKMITGVAYGSRFGLKGSEDLGGGTKAIFTLEAGFNTLNGAETTDGLIFNRQAFVGMTNPSYGTVTAGRQYMSYYQIMYGFGPTVPLTGFGAHSGDVDGLDTVYRTNNTILYTSPMLYGFTVSGSYSFGGVPGSVNRGASWSVAARYDRGPFGVGVGVSRIDNATLGGGPFGASSTTSNAGAQAGVSSVTNGYQTAQGQQRFAVGASYAITSTLDIRGTYTNVQYIPGSGSAFHNTQIFNTGGVAVHWKPTTVWDLAAGYSYTRATKANGISDSARYQQFTLGEFYALSKRTNLYALEAYARAGGKTLGTTGAGSIINATATIGDTYNATPSSSRSMVGVVVGLVHKF
ncbi:porin [Burkholderia territorii]|nr:porin [Burkholderia territorii]KUZ59720.1 porin [Burkholderia territorii]